MTTIKAYNVDTRDFEYVKQNDTGLLISGGGGGGGDATAANQTLQLTAATSSNLAVCSRLDTIDVSANNMEIQLDKLQFTSGNLLVRDSSMITEFQASNLATNTKLGLIAEASEDILLSVDGISANQVSSNTAICSRLDEQNTLSNNIVQILSDTVAVINYGIVTNTPPTYIPIKASNTGNLFVYDAQTHSELQGSNLAQYTKLDLIQSGTDINSGYLQSITTKITPLQQGIARYTIEGKTTLAPDTVPAYSAPPSGIPASEGWYYKNTSAGNTSQLFYYANLASQVRNHDYTISLIQSQWAVVRLLNLTATTSLPFLVVYSQPTGSGDFIPGFARSRFVYTIASGQELRLGEKILIYQGTQPDSRIYSELRRVQCSLTVTNGPGLSTEILAYATVNTDSGAPVNTVEYIVSGAGLTFQGDNVYNVELTGESSTVSTSDATAANQVASNVAICSRLDASNVVLASMATDTTLVLDELEALNITYTSLQEGNSNLYVYDVQTESKLNDCLTELQFINGSLDAVKSGTSEFWVRTTSADDSIEIHGYNPVLAMPEAIHTVDNAAKVYVNNDVTLASGTEVGLVSGTQVGLTAGSTVQLVSSEVALASGTVVGLVAGTSLDVLNFPVKQSVFVENTAEGYDINVNVTNTGSLNTNITNASLDVNCYGVHDGTPTLLKTTSQGEVVTHSQTRDGSGASITSTEEGAKRALDVNLINSVGVQNVSGTSLQVGKPNSVVSTLYTGAISASFLGNADLDGFSSFDLLVTIPAGAASVAGQLYICVSDNGTDWYFTNFSVTISIDAVNVRRYTTSVPSLNSRYVCVTGSNPFGTPLTTTNSTIKISAKK